MLKKNILFKIIIILLLGIIFIEVFKFISINKEYQSLKKIDDKYTSIVNDIDIYKNIMSDYTLVNNDSKNNQDKIYSLNKRIDDLNKEIDNYNTKIYKLNNELGLSK